MRLLIIYLLLFIAILAFSPLSYGVTLEYNLHTYHYFESCEVAENFANKVSNCGKGISNPILGIKGKYFRGFIGSNSVGSPLLGVTYTREFAVMGAYLQDTLEFKRRNIGPVGFEIGKDIMLTPIMGIELDGRIRKAKVFTIVTPILLTVGIGYDF